MKAIISLVPLGSVPTDLLPWLAERLSVVFNRPVIVDEPIPLPAAGYERHRRQYRGDVILAALKAVASPAVERVLGVIDADCYAPGLNFIFGQATLEGRTAFIALPRLRPFFYGLAEDPPLFRQRVLIEAVHELGHTWGLIHCPDPHCVMHFSNTLHDTDVKGAAFCQRCQDRWQKRSQARR
ncbi:MAG: peptidase [Chloroflexota bacterium]|nr:MAG: peptidase [Chloroflexota bacterium]